MDKVKKRRGRQPNQTKQVSIIKDPSLGPFHIEVSKNSFDIWKTGDDKPLGFCSSLKSALKFIIKQNSPKLPDVLTIKDYINHLTELERKINGF